MATASPGGIPCVQCNRTFVDEIALNQHKVTSSAHLKNLDKEFMKKQHYCEQCKKIFKDGAALRQHLENTKIHVKQNKEIQTQIGDTKPLTSLNKDHLFLGGKARLMCRGCDKVFGDTIALVQHLKSKPSHTGNIVKTTRAEQPENRQPDGLEKVSSSRPVMVHDPVAITEGNDSAFVGNAGARCTLCDRTFKDTASLRAHIENSKAHKSISRAYRCEDCDKDFVDEVALKQHMGNSGKHAGHRTPPSNEGRLHLLSQSQNGTREKTKLQNDGGSEGSHVFLDSLEDLIVFSPGPSDSEAPAKASSARVAKAENKPLENEPAAKKLNKESSSIRLNISPLVKHAIHDSGSQCVCQDCNCSFNNRYALKQRLSSSVHDRGSRWPALAGKPDQHASFSASNRGEKNNACPIGRDIQKPQTQPEYDADSEDCEDLDLLYCEKCRLAFPHKAAYEAHLQTAQHLFLHFICPQCSSAFGNQAVLDYHMEKLHLLHACRHCAQTFTTSDAMHRHIRRVHSTFPCRFCRRRAFRDENQLGKHILREHTFSCGECEQVLPTRDSLEAHSRKEHSKKQPTNLQGSGPISCEVCLPSCGKSFWTQLELAEHIYSHLGKAFPSQKSNLNPGTELTPHTQVFGNMPEPVLSELKRNQTSADSVNSKQPEADTGIQPQLQGLVKASKVASGEGGSAMVTFLTVENEVRKPHYPNHLQLLSSSESEPSVQARNIWSVVAETPGNAEHLSKLVHSEEVLLKNAYTIAIPTREDYSRSLRCTRCHRKAEITLERPECCYHIGKPKFEFNPLTKSNERLYPCCKQLPGSKGCKQSSHSFESYEAMLTKLSLSEAPDHAPADPYHYNFRKGGENSLTLSALLPDAAADNVNEKIERIDSERGIENLQTQTVRNSQQSRLFAVAIDCEMGITQTGERELIQLVVVDYFTGKVLLNKLVLPKVKMRNLQTRYSGVTQQMLDNAVRNHEHLDGWEEARKELFKIIDKETILIGHSLNNDLNALHIIHRRVVDPAIAIPRRTDGLGKGHGLKALALEITKKAIQTGIRGHNCLEDALAARELVIWCANNKTALESRAEIVRKKLERSTLPPPPDTCREISQKEEGSNGESAKIEQVVVENDHREVMG